VQNAVKDLERELSLKTADLASAQQQLQSQCNDKNSTSKLLLARFNLVLDTKKRYIRELEAEGNPHNSISPLDCYTFF
jgi:hypothetical protein